MCVHLITGHASEGPLGVHAELVLGARFADQALVKILNMCFISYNGFLIYWLTLRLAHLSTSILGTDTEFVLSAQHGLLIKH